MLPEHHDIDEHRHPAADRAPAELRQEMHPALAGREGESMRQRHEQQQRHRQHQQRRDPDIARAAQAHAAAEIQAVEELVARGEPQQLHAQRDRGPASASCDAGEERQDPRTAERDQDADRAHVERGQQDHTVADPQRPLARAGADRLPDESRAGGGDAEARHVGERGEDHDHLRGGAAGGAEARLHHLEDGEPEQVRRRRQPHRHAEPQLLHQHAAAAARQVRWER